jgi:putative colanic acid biosynthesis acetyltransferase WcaF
MPLVWDQIKIGSECWIAAGSWILPGVTVGNGAVIGARSLVNKSMPEWMVCAGHPCSPKKARIIQNINK